MNLPVSKRTIAVVDDDTSMTRALARLVQTAGYAVQTYASATEFLENCAIDTIQCLVLDVQMPGMDGFELAAALEERGISVPMLFITAHDSPGAREKAAKAHAQGFFVKPFDPKELLEIIFGILQPGAAG